MSLVLSLIILYVGGAVALSLAINAVATRDDADTDADFTAR